MIVRTTDGSYYKKGLKDINKKLFFLFILLNIIDIIQTYIGVILRGMTEQNPIIRFLINNPAPLITLITVKIIVVGVIYILIQNKKEKHQLTVLSIINGLMIAVVILNFLAL